MNLNTRLFFRINGLAGSNRCLDALGRMGAEWAIIASVAWYVSAMFEYHLEGAVRIKYIVFSTIIWLVAFGMNNIIGRIFVHESRPFVTHPKAKHMFTPIGKKSFPSDHAMTAWLLFFLAVFLAIPGASALALLALWVSWGRVYAGVHYPGDILGGFVVAAIAVMASKYFFIFLI